MDFCKLKGSLVLHSKTLSYKKKKPRGLLHPQMGSPQADEARHRQRPDNTRQKGAAINTNEAGSLKAFYSEAECPPWEQCALLPWFPGTRGRKGAWGWE